MTPSYNSGEQAMAVCLEQADNRLKRLLGKILFEPEQVTQSTLKHLGTDVAVWHNSLNFLARKASEPMATLMVLMADVMREGKTEELFGVRELTDIARMSMGTWLNGTHNDKTRLRLQAALVLGEMLEDPERGAHARAVLATIQSKDRVPAAANDLEQATQQAMDRHLPAMKEWAKEMVMQEDEDDYQSVSSALILARMILDDQATLHMTGADWRVGDAMAADNPDKALNEVLTRLERRVMDAAAPYVEGIKPASPSVAKPPKP